MAASSGPFTRITTTITTWFNFNTKNKDHRWKTSYEDGDTKDQVEEYISMAGCDAAGSSTVGPCTDALACKVTPQFLSSHVVKDEIVHEHTGETKLNKDSIGGDYDNFKLNSTGNKVMI